MIANADMQTHKATRDCSKIIDEDLTDHAKPLSILHEEGRRQAIRHAMMPENSLQKVRTSSC